MCWFPQYGAALVVLPPHSTQAVPGETWLSVLALDDWGFRLHRCEVMDGWRRHVLPAAFHGWLLQLCWLRSCAVPAVLRLWTPQSCPPSPHTPLRNQADGSAQHTSTCEGSRLLPCGVLPQEQLSAYLARLDSLLAKAQKRHDEQRSSHGSKRQGHQKTPALIHALALQVRLLCCCALAGRVLLGNNQAG